MTAQLWCEARCNGLYDEAPYGCQTSAMVVKYAGPARQKARAKQAQGLRK